MDCSKKVKNIQSKTEGPTFFVYSMYIPELHNIYIFFSYYKDSKLAMFWTSFNRYYLKEIKKIDVSLSGFFNVQILWVHYFWIKVEGSDKLVMCIVDLQAVDEEVSPNEYLKLRTQHVQQQKDEGKVIFPHKFHVSTSLTEFLRIYENLGKEEEGKEEVTVAGRIHAIRESSQKLRFYDLRGEGVKLQVRCDDCYSELDLSCYILNFFFCSKFHAL